MANQTINGLTATDSGASTDWIPIWKTALGITRKIAIGDLLGGYLTGGGTIATAGFTGTLPRTGTLVTSYSGTQSPAPTITGSSSNPTVTYTTQLGMYKRIDDLVFYQYLIVINTFSGGSGEVRIPLPFTAANNGMNSAGVGADSGFTAGTGEHQAVVSANTNYIKLRVGGANYQISALGAGDSMSGSVVYLAAS